MFNLQKKNLQLERFKLMNQSKKAERNMHTPVSLQIQIQI